MAVVATVKPAKYKEKPEERAKARWRALTREIAGLTVVLRINKIIPAYFVAKS
jgi:hypothetical protein